MKVNSKDLVANLFVCFKTGEKLENHGTLYISHCCGNKIHLFRKPTLWQKIFYKRIDFREIVNQLDSFNKQNTISPESKPRLVEILTFIIGRKETKTPTLWEKILGKVKTTWSKASLIEKAKKLKDSLGTPPTIPPEPTPKDPLAESIPNNPDVANEPQQVQKKDVEPLEEDPQIFNVIEPTGEDPKISSVLEPQRETPSDVDIEEPEVDDTLDNPQERNAAENTIFNMLKWSKKNNGLEPQLTSSPDQKYKNLDACFDEVTSFHKPFGSSPSLLHKLVEKIDQEWARKWIMMLVKKGAKLDYVPPGDNALCPYQKALQVLHRLENDFYKRDWFEDHESEEQNIQEVRSFIEGQLKPRMTSKLLSDLEKSEQQRTRLPFNLPDFSKKESNNRIKKISDRLARPYIVDQSVQSKISDVNLQMFKTTTDLLVEKRKEIAKLEAKFRIDTGNIGVGVELGEAKFKAATYERDLNHLATELTYDELNLATDELDPIQMAIKLRSVHLVKLLIEREYGLRNIRPNKPSILSLVIRGLSQTMDEADQKFYSSFLNILIRNGTPIESVFRENKSGNVFNIFSELPDIYLGMLLMHSNNPTALVNTYDKSTFVFPLSIVFKMDRPKLFEYLLYKKADVRALGYGDHPWNALLIESIKMGNLKMVDFLLGKMRNLINIKDEDGNTPAHIALLLANRECYKLLEKYRPDKKVPNKSGFSCEQLQKKLRVESLNNIMACIEAGKYEDNSSEFPISSLENALSWMLDINATRDNEGNTFLHKALQKYPGGLDIIMILLLKGADLTKKNYKGITPLMLIENQDLTPIIERYKEIPRKTDKQIIDLSLIISSLIVLKNLNGEDVNVLIRWFSNSDKSAIVYQLIKNKNLDMGELSKLVSLVSHKDLNIPCDDEGNTLLHRAIAELSIARTNKEMKWIETLIKAGADINQQNNQGIRPKDLGRTKGLFKGDIVPRNNGRGWIVENGQMRVTYEDFAQAARALFYGIGN